MIRLGQKVKDNITGFEGIATGKTEWLFGCSRYCVEPQELKDGKPVEAVWFDEQRLEIIADTKPEVSKDSDGERPGGPQNDPRPRACPTR